VHAGGRSRGERVLPNGIIKWWGRISLRSSSANLRSKVVDQKSPQPPAPSKKLDVDNELLWSTRISIKFWRFDHADESTYHKVCKPRQVMGREYHPMLLCYHEFDGGRDVFPIARALIAMWCDLLLGKNDVLSKALYCDRDLVRSYWKACVHKKWCPLKTEMRNYKCWTIRAFFCIIQKNWFICVETSSLSQNAVQPLNMEAKPNPNSLKFVCLIFC